jgi:hypothetical protein
LEVSRIIPLEFTDGDIPRLPRGIYTITLCYLDLHVQYPTIGGLLYHTILNLRFRLSPTGLAFREQPWGIGRMGIDAFLKRAGVDFANVEVLILVLRDCNRCRLGRIGGSRAAE